VHLFYRAVRQGNYSSIGYCKLDGPLKITQRSNKPILKPEHDYEKQGIEDPRIIFFEGKYFMIYTVYDGQNALVAYATSKDLLKWTKKGIISPKISYREAIKYFNKSDLKEKYFHFYELRRKYFGDNVLLWDKDAFILPKRINNKIVMFHRFLPDIQIAYFKNFNELTHNWWIKYLSNLKKYVVLEPCHNYECRNVGGGAPAIETDKGWLLIYHSVEETTNGRLYHASAALLDRKNPCKIIGRLKRPLISPTESYEKYGDANHVIFPTGTARFGNRLYIYYGAADSRIAVASLDINNLLAELIHSES